MCVFAGHGPAGGGEPLAILPPPRQRRRQHRSRPPSRPTRCIAAVALRSVLPRRTQGPQHRFEPVDEPLPGRVLDKLLQQPDALARSGTETLVPIPPIVTSRSTRSGLWIAKLMPTPPPIDLPTMCTFSTPSASRKGETVPYAVTIGWPPKSSLTRNREIPGCGQRKCLANVGRIPRKLRQPVTPGPEPCRKSSTGPESWPQS